MRHIGIQEFFLGEKSSDKFFLVLIFLYRGGPMVYFKEKYNFPRFQVGPTYGGGGGGGVVVTAPPNTHLVEANSVFCKCQ